MSLGALSVSVCRDVFESPLKTSESADGGCDSS